MTLTSAPPTLAVRLRHDPAVALWSVAGLCWAATFVLVLTGGVEAAHHDHVLEHSTLPWTLRPARIALYLGYLAVWTAFAPVALFADAGLHLLVHSWPWLEAHEGVILGSALLMAGAFQFSRLKNACLTACRSPESFLWQHYRRGARGGFALGARHGLSCVGCCWALMLVMFATGVGGLAWMLALTAIMVAEKTTRVGARLVVPVGIAFLLVGAGLSIAALFQVA
jgi:predicted metal-binding membrane protein